VASVNGSKRVGTLGQQVAIAQYSNLRPDGKGAFQNSAIRSPLDVLPGLLLVLGLTAQILDSYVSVFAVGMALGGVRSVIIGAWFNHKLGGHTGDTYGAVVEWTEAVTLPAWH